MCTIYYKFDHFCLKNGHLIEDDKGEVALAPKESAVLLFMLQNANDIVSKEDLIRDVWRGGTVSDESLTRCIYVLRRALGHTSSKKFIQTVYGKGYRFLPSVDIVEEAEVPPNENFSDLSNKYNIALFPFEMKNVEVSASLHDQLVEWLQRFRVNNNFSIDVVSSYLTRSFQDYNRFLATVEKSKIDYYIAGAEISYGNESIVRIELVSAKDHSVVCREGVHLVKDQHINYRALCRTITTLLDIVSCDINSKVNDKKTEVKISTTEKNNVYNQHYSLSVLKKGMPLIIEKVIKNGGASSKLYEIASIYYAIVNLGLLDCGDLDSEINAVLGTILASEKNNSIALSLQGLLTNDDDAEGKFQLAMILSPGVAEVFHYYACYLVKQGDFNKALQMNNFCLELNDSLFSSKVLRVIILHLKGHTQMAVEYGESVLATQSPFTSIMEGLLTIIYVREGELKKIKTFSETIESNMRTCEFMSYCHSEVENLFQKRKDNYKLQSTISTGKVNLLEANPLKYSFAS